MDTAKTTHQKKGEMQSAEQERADRTKQEGYSNRWKVMFANAGTGKILDTRAVLR